MNVFDFWNILKKRIDQQNRPAPYYPKEKEVWMCSLGKNIGFEQDGGGNNFNRPVLIIKKFNNQMFLIIPLSTKQKDLDFYYNYADPFGHPVSAILAQLKLISIKRLNRKLYACSSKNFDNIKNNLRKMFV